jgi:methyl-accepting chemotaxis protein
VSSINKAISAELIAPGNNKTHNLPHIRPDRRRSGSLLMNFSIGTRLILSFIISALIASTVSGAIGFQHTQSLNKQSDFYLNLLQSNTNLTTGAQFLQEINSVTQNILVLANVNQSSQETLRDNLISLQNLYHLYDNTLKSFVADQLVSRYPDEKMLLDEANHDQQIQQQQTLAASALRTWQVAHQDLGTFTDDITGGHFDTAAIFQQAQVEPTNADAVTSLRSLVNFNKKLAGSVKDAADVEASNELITTIISSVIAFIAIIFIGWLISGTLVRRLLLLRQVTQAVENGELSRRVRVIGRDEIADVSASVNAMLDAISNLIAETRSQRDAMANAADHLFSDMRVVSAGDLRVNAPVSNDPIGMLANAFNFTVGRFRRFVLRTKTLSEQLTVIAHQEIEHAEALSLAVQNVRSNANSQHNSSSTAESGIVRQEKRAVQNQPIESNPLNTQLMAHIRRTREQLKHISQEGIISHTHAVAALSEQMTQTLNRLHKFTRGELGLPERASAANMINIYVQELRTLDLLLACMAMELQNVQKNTIRGFQDLDQDLQQLAMTVCQQKSRTSISEISPVVNTEQDPRVQDVLRLAASFANEVSSLSQQLTKLTQEIRNSIVSFQFEGADTLVNNVSGMPAQFSSPLRSGSNFANNAAPKTGSLQNNIPASFNRLSYNAYSVQETISES